MTEVKLEVLLVAATSLANEGYLPLTGRASEEWHVSDADFLAEFAGRSCYESYTRPNPKTATNDSYLKNIIDQQHFSVLEHGSATFYITGVSRNLTHELVRHRHLSFSQLSQRYVDETYANHIVPPALLEDKNSRQYLDLEMANSTINYVNLITNLQENGITGKKAREAARAMLLGMTETKIVVTGNHRAWREFLQKRLSPSADAEIRRLAEELLRQLRELAPSTYQDL